MINEIIFMKPAVIFFFCTLLLGLQISPVQSQQVVFNKVLPPEGRSFQHITGITQDKQGYMWLATRIGLYRYDGYNFVTYKNNPSNLNSLASNWLECVYADSSGMIWIGTYGAGLDQLDPSTDVFTHFRHNSNNPKSLSSDIITSVLQDHMGTLWVGTYDGGLNQFDYKTINFNRYLHRANDPASLSSNQVRALYEDRQGTLWIGTGNPYYEGKSEEGGLNRLVKKTGKFISYLHDANDLHSLMNNKVRAIFEDRKGNFWIGTAGDGLHTMDRVRGTFERHTYDPAHPEKLSRSHLHRSEYRTDWIAFIREDTTGAIWIGTTESGINYYDPRTQKIMHYESGKDTAGAFTDRQAWWAYTSREGVVWISTVNGNLYRIDPFQRTIPHYTSPGAVIEAFLEEPGVLWVGTVDGLYRKDLTAGKVTQYRHDPLNPVSLSHNYIQHILKDTKGKIWISTLGGGLNVFNKGNATFARYSHDPKNSSSLSNNWVHFIYEDPKARLWLGTAMGLNLMDHTTAKFTHYFIDQKDSVPYSKNFITYVLQDRQGNLWVLLEEEGVYYMDFAS